MEAYTEKNSTTNLRRSCSVIFVLCHTLFRRNDSRITSNEMIGNYSTSYNACRHTCECLTIKRSFQIDHWYSRMANSFLGNGSVQQLQQRILTKNDTCKICRTCFGLSKNSKRGGGKKGRQRPLGTHEYWVRPPKSGKF